MGKDKSLFWVIMNKVIIKKLEVSDCQQWKKIRLEALKNSPDNFMSSYQDEVNYSDDHFTRGLEASIIFGCFIQDEIVGCCGLVVEKASKISHTGTLWGMYIKEDARGGGVGLSLVSHVKDYAKSYIKHLYLGCNAENQSAIKLYRKCGFKVYGTRPNYTKIGDKFYDDLIMMCEL